MYPNAEEFIATFSNYPPIIRVVYQKTVTNPNNSLLQSNPVDDSEGKFFEYRYYVWQKKKSLSH